MIWKFLFGWRNTIPPLIYGWEGVPVYQWFSLRWDEFLPYVTFAYNTARQETTNYSPFDLLYGRETTTLVDLEYLSTSDAWVPIKDAKMSYAERLTKHLTEARSVVQSHAAKAKGNQKKGSDATHTDKNSFLVILC